MHRRLVRLTVVVIAASVGLFTMAFWVLLRSWMHHDADVLLASRARSAAALVAVDAGRLVVEETPGDEAVEPEMWLFDLRSSPVVRPPGGRSLDAAAATLAASGPGTRVVSGVELRSLPVGDGARRIGVVVVALGLAPYVHSERLAVGAAVALDLVIVAGAVVLVHRLVGSALRPVADMTTRAREWAVHDLDQRFGLGPPRDEITGLAVTLDSLFARLAASLRHETLLTAQIAHELKAPLARLRAVAEASARYDTRPRQLRTALHQVIGEVDQLAGVVETLLKAHNGSATTGRVDLTEAAARVTRAATTAHPRVQVHVHGVAQPALCDPDLAERILAPIVDNALRYARSAITVQIGAASPGHDEASTVRVLVQDDGPGFRPDEVDAVFDPGYRGAAATGDGAGLGLPLARRLARLVGGDVLVVPERHGQVAVILPALPGMWRA
ncbi:HAMP domain-containing sensor histidine kinase [Frankia sp. R82]|uniref:sensor histidine kinase n=1 Tax=Frankia sp. R82 TaxID=2950553 RepID=UPI002042EA10|nr:HAMP domain-containing sensor histidine kinase [Frankia sp. R82]MCM3883361.1 HAMP domain-containing histidine kinase [Frankia sp. R82]